MYRVPYLRFAAHFPICSFSGVKCWYGDRLHVTVHVVTSHITTAYNFAEKTFMNWLQTAKFAKVFSLESFPLYGRWKSKDRTHRETKMGRPYCSNKTSLVKNLAKKAWTDPAGPKHTAPLSLMEKILVLHLVP